MSSAYVLRDVAFSYSPKGPSLLSIPELVIERGSRVFIQGGSGSGKTTLLSVLAGVLTPTEGRISLLDIENFSALRGSRRDAVRARHIGFIFQMFNLLPYLSVIENVLLGLRFSPERTATSLSRGSLRQEATRLLQRLGISDTEMLSRVVTDLSVGQQQRVSAARALIGAPEVIIADEPTSALDADSRDRFLDLLISECNEAGSTLIFVSHDSSLSSHFDRIITMGELTSGQGTGDASVLSHQGA